MPLVGEYGPGTSEWARVQAETFEASGGVEGATLGDGDQPIIVLTTVGARSGLLRKTALMRVEHDGRYVVVASKAGAPKHPQWYWNAVEHPHVELQDGATKRDYLARELSGTERDVWWARAVAAYPDYLEYQERTSRTIPLLLLEPFTEG